MDILGARVDNLEKKEILEKIEVFLAGDRPCQIVTVNPEFILEAQRDEEFKNILNSCELNIADGIGIKIAFWRFGEKLKTRIAGVDLMEKILQIASNRGLGIFLVVNKNGLGTWEETRDAILIKYPNLKIGGSNMEKFGNCYLEIGNCEKYEIIFANHGAPFQEKFLHSLKNQKNDRIRLAMGVGGSLDYLTGKVQRAPKWMRKLGLEWLFRLWKQPNRFQRIFNAVIIFPIKIIINKKTYDNQSQAN
jgi:N-acetylglucosaminyldiphosphoundecaprenol N-acetyl-beta-D-mannosaminyltransferase